MSVESEAKTFCETTGINLPKSLIDLYSLRGNGGFGPDYGMLGIVTGHKTDLNDSMLTLYQVFAAPDPEDPKWDWPKELIPFIHIGCAIHLCIDSSSATYRVVEFDPNDYDPENGWPDHFNEISSSFDTWVQENV